jgi:hypothetical protein
MAKVLLKKSSVSSNAPGTGDLEYGEVALNYADGRLYYKNSSNIIKNFVDSDLIDNKIGSTIQAYDANLTSFVNTFTLPTSDGSNGQVIKTDGAGNLSFADAASQTLTIYEYTATGGQTTFTGADDNAATLSYTVGSIIVSLNGIVLRPGDDYTASNGTSIVLNSGATAGDDLQVIAFTTFNVATYNDITSSNFAGVQTLTIYNSSGTALKTMYSPTT